MLLYIWLQFFRVFHLECLQNKSFNESEACDSASVVPIHTRSEVSSDSDSASVASVNQPLEASLLMATSKHAIYDT